ncbi:hydrophobin [Phlebiopsis gigantea 11061_1 CR5-6]|uniref:Hydrophobin n=1 Tax=Phlebiopsis gigantea (strain 11061_1 CR5-6) TaxID=745531 RepID=A0A0C3S1R8_PHLG1|nr:hydrophobin [Phlebiopsis gigantea 11061_1 CR5-6]
MKFSAAALLALPLLAVATPLEVRQNGSCDTGSLQCCESTVEPSDVPSDPLVGAILGLLGIVVGDLTGLVGLTCSPISVVGIGSGDACTASPVCCTNSNVGGLISIGCVPVSL